MNGWNKRNEGKGGDDNKRKRDDVKKRANNSNGKKPNTYFKNNVKNTERYEYSMPKEGGDIQNFEKIREYDLKDEKPNCIKYLSENSVEWIIHGVISNKKTIKAKNGVTFSVFYLKDSQKDIIKCLSFDNVFQEKVFPFLLEGESYYLTSGQIRIADTRYNGEQKNKHDVFIRGMDCIKKAKNPVKMLGGEDDNNNNNNIVMKNNDGDEGIVEIELGNEEPISINQLSELSTDWIIHGIISDKKILKMKSGKGSFCIFYLTDSKRDIVKCLSFDKDFQDRIFPEILDGESYYLMRGQIKVADKRYNSEKGNMHDIYIREIDSLKRAKIPVEMISEEQYQQNNNNNNNNVIYQDLSCLDLTKIEDIFSVQVNTNINVLGCVVFNDGVGNLKIKSTGKNIEKRVIKIMDETNCTIDVVFWGEQAKVDHVERTVLFLQNVVIKEYMGKRTLNVNSSTKIFTNPEELESVGQLLNWFNYENKYDNYYSAANISFPSSSCSSSSRNGKERKEKSNMIKQAKEGDGEKVWINFDISKILAEGRDIMYPACSSTFLDCKKKMNKLTDGDWQCSACGFISNKCNWRYILKADIVDASGDAQATFFDESARLFFNGLSANEIIKLKESSEGLDHLARLFKDNEYKKFTGIFMRKENHFNDKVNIELQNSGLETFDYVEESKRLISQIAKYEKK